MAAEAALGLGPRRSVITYAASDTTGPVTETMQSLDSGPAEGTPARVRTDHAALFNGLRALSRYASAHSAHLGWNSWHHHPRVLMLPTVLFLGFLVMSSTNERVSYPVQGSALIPFCMVAGAYTLVWYTCRSPSPPLRRRRLPVGAGGRRPQVVLTAPISQRRPLPPPLGPAWVATPSLRLPRETRPCVHLPWSWISVSPRHRVWGWALAPRPLGV